MNARVRPRWKLGALGVLLVAIGLMAVPAVQAAKPTRTALQPTTEFLDAGLACAFRVELAPLARSSEALTGFADGRTVINSSGRQTITNSENEKAIVVDVAFTWTERYDKDANDLLIDLSGQEVFFFYPGDQGPFGEVGANGGLVHVTGRVSETWDLDEDVITSFSYKGKAIELCSKIS